MLIVLLFYFTERRTLEQWYHGPVLAGNQSFAELENQYVEIEVIGLYGPYNIMTHETNGKEFIDKEYYVARECNNGELIALLNSPGLTTIKLVTGCN